MFLDFILLHEMPANKMTIDEMFEDKMTIDNMTFYRPICIELLWSSIFFEENSPTRYYKHSSLWGPLVGYEENEVF